MNQEEGREWKDDNLATSPETSLYAKHCFLSISHVFVHSIFTQHLHEKMKFSNQENDWDQRN